MTDGISRQKINPNSNAAKGSDPESSIEDVPESIWFKLTVENIYGSANENVECSMRNNVTKAGLTEMTPSIWLKFVNGIKAIEMNMIEQNSIVYV